MARKKKKNKTPLFSFGFFGPAKKKKKTKAGDEALGIRIILAILTVVVVIGAIATAFKYLRLYVRNIQPDQTDIEKLELMPPPPDWIRASRDLQQMIRLTALAGNDSMPLNTETAKTVAGRIEKLDWLYDVRVKTHVDPESQEKILRIGAKYRKPVAYIQHNQKKYFLAWLDDPKDPLYSEDEKRIMLLDHTPLENLNIIEISGFSSKLPSLEGDRLWHSREMISTVKLLVALAKMDEKTLQNEQIKRPLLEDIKNVDITNYGGRKDRKKAHVVLYAKDGTEIRWGAAFDEAFKYLEATEIDKISQLYEFFQRHGTVQSIENNIGQYIDLRQAKNEFPRPPME